MKPAQRWDNSGEVRELILAAYNAGVKAGAATCDRSADDNHQVGCSYWSTCHREMARSIRNLIKPFVSSSGDR